MGSCGNVHFAESHITAAVPSVVLVLQFQRVCLAPTTPAYVITDERHASDKAIEKAVQEIVDKPLYKLHVQKDPVMAFEVAMLSKFDEVKQLWQ